MTKAILPNSFFIIGILLLLSISGLSGQNFTGESKIILDTEKGALDKWINRNVWGYLDLFAENATYFDTSTKMQLIGYKAIKDYIAPWDGKIYAPRYEMQNIDIKVNGNIGVLTYNLYDFNESNDTTALWNSSEIYQKIEGEWKIIHSHWSLVDLKK